MAPVQSLGLCADSRRETLSVYRTLMSSNLGCRMGHSLRRRDTSKFVLPSVPAREYTMCRGIKSTLQSHNRALTDTIHKYLDSTQLLGASTSLFTNIKHIPANNLPLPSTKSRSRSPKSNEAHDLIHGLRI